MSALAPEARRYAASPFAKRLARERGIALELLQGSGPSGRIVAADVESYLPGPAPAVVQAPSQPSAFGCSINLAATRQLLGNFAQVEMPFTLEDVILLAAGRALEDVAVVGGIEERAVALELRPRQLVFSDICGGSLAPLRGRRLAAIAAELDESTLPAALCIRLIEWGEVRPVSMPLLAGRSMRLVVAAGSETAEGLLSFDGSEVSEDIAAELLGRFKGYLEVPLRLLA